MMTLVSVVLSLTLLFSDAPTPDTSYGGEDNGIVVMDDIMVGKP